MSETFSKQVPQPWDAAILVAVGTALAYAGAFEFQAGYIGHFGVPHEFAEVDMRDLLGAAAILVLIAIPIGQTADFLYEIWLRRLPPGTQRAAAIFVTVTAALFTLDFLSAAPWFIWLTTMSLPFLYMLQLTLLGFLGPRETPFLQRVELALGRGHGPPTGVLPVRLLERAGKRVGQVFVASVIVFVFSNAFGGFVARTQKEFLVNAWEPCIVIRSSSTGLLCVDYDADTHKAMPSYQILAPAGARLTLRKVGPFPTVEAPK